MLRVLSLAPLLVLLPARAADPAPVPIAEAEAEADVVPGAAEPAEETVANADEPAPQPGDRFYPAPRFRRAPAPAATPGMALEPLPGPRFRATTLPVPVGPLIPDEEPRPPAGGPGRRRAARVVILVAIAGLLAVRSAFGLRLQGPIALE